MKCRNAEKKLEGFLLRALDVDEHENIERHLRNCGRCRSRIAELRRAVERFKTEALPEHSSINSDFSECLSRVQKEIHSVRVHRRLRYVTSWTIRIAAVLAVGISLFKWSSFSRSPSPATAGEFPSVKWKIDGVSSAYAVEYPLIEGSRVIAFTGRNTGRPHIAVYESETGNRLWQSRDTVVPLMTSDGTRVFTCSKLGQHYAVTALDLDTGEKAWQVPVEQHAPILSVEASPGILCWITRYGVNVTDTNDGTLQWKYSFNWTPIRLSRPCIADRDTLILAWGKACRAFNLKTGNLEWAYKFTGKAVSPVAPMLRFGKGLVFLCRRTNHWTGTLTCLDSQTGRKIWESDTIAADSLDYCGNRIYAKGQGIEAFSAASGEKLWAGNIAGGCSPLTVEGQQIYALSGREKDELWSYESVSGQIYRTYELDEGSCTGLRIEDGQGFISTRSGRMIAMGLGQ